MTAADRLLHNIECFAHETNKDLTSGYFDGMPT